MNTETNQVFFVQSKDYSGEGHFFYYPPFDFATLKEAIVFIKKVPGSYLMNMI